MNQVLRQQVLERDKFSCQYCGKYRNKLLDTHHIVPRDEGGSDNMINLITLCRKCHRAADHDIRFGLLVCDGCKMLTDDLLERHDTNMSFCSTCDKLFFKRNRLV